MRKLPKKALAAKRLKSIADQERISLRDSFRGWQSIPRFFREIYAAGPRLFILNLLGRLLKGFSPVVLLWIGKVIIDEIVFLLNNPDGD